jgi:acyl-CoA dehydrogenase
MSESAVSAEDFELIREQVRHFVRTAVLPREVEIMMQDRIPDDLRAAAAAMGLFGYAVPAEWGGLGLDLTQDVELAMELGYTTLSLRSMFGTNNGIAGQVLVGFGTDDQRAQWLERIAAGDVVAAFALTEPGAGSNPAGLRTRARRDGDQWVIDGHKQFITNAPIADLFIVFARTAEPRPGEPGIAVFLVPSDRPGLSVGPKDAKMSQEGAWTADVRFDDVRVPLDALVGGDEAGGYRAAMTSLARGRVHIAALAVGTAQRALDESVAYAAASTRAASGSVTSNWSRPCWPTSKPGSWPAGRWFGRPPGPTSVERTVGSRPRRPSCSAPRWSAAWPIWPSRCTAGPATCGRFRWSGSTATSGYCGCTRAPARSSASSSAVR